MLHGILNIYKPLGITSRDAVDAIQKCLRPNKVGHAGTLDPLAEGVLLMAVGWAVRLIPYLQSQPKTYVGQFRLGVFSDSLDCDTPIQPLENAPKVEADALRQACAKWVGFKEQTPPVYSALKVRGKRACDRIRNGEAVTLAPRRVQIHSITCEEFTDPNFRLNVCCGSGTYMRSLGDDIARELGSRAIMTGLCREQIGPFHAKDALKLDQLCEATILEHLQPSVMALQHLPKIICSADEIADIQKGRFLNRKIDGPEAACLDEQHRLRAIMVQRTKNLIGPKRVFPDH